MTANLPLFNDDDPMPASSARTLVVRANGGRALDKKAQAFNRLLGKVHGLEARFEREKRRLDDALVFHAAEVRPRLERVAGLRKDVVRALQPFLDDSRLKERDRSILADILAGQLEEILQHDESPGQDLRQLFERLHGIDLSEVVQGQIDEAKAAMAEMFADIGLDMDVPDLRPDMSEEEVAATVAQMADRMRQLEDARFAGQPSRRKTKREMKEEARAQQFERLRKIGIGSIYKRLAKALHPDLEPDAALRERKSALMQKVTAAYARNDVHALLRLELEWMGGDHLDASQMTEETLQAYSALLKQQVAELEAACVELPFHPRYEALLDAHDPLGLAIGIDGPSEARRLDLVIDGLAAALQRMAAGQAWREVRALIQEHRRATRMRSPY